MTDKQKWLGAGGLVLVWITLFSVMVISAPPPEEVPLKYRTGKVMARATAAAPDQEWTVHSLHAQERQLPDRPKRNIFLPPPRPVEPQVTRVARQKKPQPLIAETAPPTPPVPPPPTPEELAQQQEALRRQQLQEQMAQYRYLGYVNRNGVQQAFLGKGREIYIIREGDTLEGKFQVALIEATSVKLFDAESKLETILKLTKDQSSGSGA